MPIPETSHCSTADTKNVPPSALEAGNAAAATIFSHYRALKQAADNARTLRKIVAEMEKHLPPDPL